MEGSKVCLAYQQRLEVSVRVALKIPMMDTNFDKLGTAVGVFHGAIPR